MIRLLLIGIAMGVADVIPGISGGTVAFLSGIYEKLLLSLQTLQLQHPSRIAWRFLLPLAGGIALGFLGFARVIYFFLHHSVYQHYLYGLFFGLILASTLLCGMKAEMKTLPRWSLFACGALIAFFLSGNLFHVESSSHTMFLLFSGSLAAGAMLLPGISGSYLLYLLGIYPLAMHALTDLSTGWKVLLPLGLGIALGLMVFSRLIHSLLIRFRFLTLSLLTGFMAGGLRSVWPFRGTPISPILLAAALGIGSVFFLEIVSKRKRV